MRNAPLIAAAGLLAYGAWRWSQSQEQGAAIEPDQAGGLLADADSVLTDASETAAEFVDNITGGILRVSNMARVPRSALSNPNVQALLRVIRAGEGTSDEGGYRRLFGGGTFASFADHPRIVVKKSGLTSTAAGAYQFLSSSWDETARIMGLSDFSPRNQDFAAVGRLAARGALDDAIAGRFEQAIRKIAREWASLPGSPYGQPTISMERARSIYAMAGGDDATATA